MEYGRMCSAEIGVQEAGEGGCRQHTCVGPRLNTLKAIRVRVWGGNTWKGVSLTGLYFFPCHKAVSPSDLPRSPSDLPRSPSPTPHTHVCVLFPVVLEASAVLSRISLLGLRGGMEKYAGHYETVNVPPLRQLRKYNCMVWKSPKGKRPYRLFMLVSVKAVTLN